MAAVLSIVLDLVFGFVLNRVNGVTYCRSPSVSLRIIRPVG